MPTDNDIGYSEYTATKEEHLRRILAQHFSITHAVIMKWNKTPQYWYIDATAGCGKVPGTDIDGSPLVALRVLDDRLQCQIDLIERHDSNCGALNLCLAWQDRQRVTIHRGDYNEIIPELLRQRPGRYGMVFVDPSGEIPNFDTLGQLARERQKMEILMYVSATNIKRDLYRTRIRLTDYLARIPKRFWLVREPMGQHQWTFLQGSNTDLFKKYEAIGFYRTDSEHGQRIIDVLNHTTREREEVKKSLQPPLLNTELMPNTCNTPDSEKCEPLHSPELAESVNDARRVR